ncbi:CASP8 and FADD-like apoptosis regulator [Mixophyes fleayi]|uniref:CASP8 and FADD-like apoptosis regulator n=1 Tax=Mixophyes fleayi TaxID=3061075 RepID=UPI003F4DF504
MGVSLLKPVSPSSLCWLLFSHPVVPSICCACGFMLPGSIHITAYLLSGISPYYHLPTSAIYPMPSDELFCRYKPHFFLNADTVAQRDIVMSSNCVSSRTVLQIEEELDCEEREVILFACQGIISNTNTRELLSELNETGLAEILYLVKRFDLLKKYLNITKADAKKLMTTKTRIISDYRNLLIDLNEQLEEEDMESLVFLLKNELRNVGKNKKKTFLTLVIELEKNHSLTPENLDLLEKSFQTIHRVDLKNRILKFKQKVPRGPYINAFAESPTIHWPVNQTSPSMGPNNGHIGAAPVQETGSVIQTEISNEKYLIKQESIGFCLIIDCVGNDAGNTRIYRIFIQNLIGLSTVSKQDTLYN